MMSPAIDTVSHPRPGRLRAMGRWLGRREVWAGLGVLALTALAATAGPPAWVSAARALGVPYCLKYSDVYLYAGGAFQRRGSDWFDLPVYSNLTVSRYEEIERDAEFIYLLNSASRNNDKVNQIVVRLPVCGGVSQVTLSKNARNWIDSQPIWR